MKSQVNKKTIFVFLNYSYVFKESLSSYPTHFIDRPSVQNIYKDPLYAWARN
jgi:hypothetical protein